MQLFFDDERCHPVALGERPGWPYKVDCHGDRARIRSQTLDVAVSLPKPPKQRSPFSTAKLRIAVNREIPRRCLVSGHSGTAPAISKSTRFRPGTGSMTSWNYSAWRRAGRGRTSHRRRSQTDGLRESK
jgi:hypothetical protein